MTDKKEEKKTQIVVLKDKLNSLDVKDKEQAIRGIISHMSNGKDVSSLFMDVLKNITTPSLQLKKLIYLYVMSYAKFHPDLAILGVNTFIKDAIDKSNPFLRALAIRTMGCIRIKDVSQLFFMSIETSLSDEEPYVRKTGALCVPKLYQIAPEKIQKTGLLKKLQDLLSDGNASVVTNALIALTICSQLNGNPLVKLNENLVQQLLRTMTDCNQWGLVYILDTLTGYLPKDPQQAENIMERVSSRLAHTNSAVALSSIRLIIRYMDFLSNAETIRTYNNKISAPLITMISRQSQISYLVLKTINLVLQKRPLLLPKELKIFFINYHDPLYIKLQKLQVLSKIANNQNILMILHQLKEYIHEVDIEFVRKTVNTMGKCAIKLQKMADKCVQCLWEVLKTKISYVVQEAVIVIRDIFRKYPSKYDGLLADICQNLNNLDDPQAKASIVWIIGQYIQMIDNADQLMANFVQNFKDQPDVVQQQILVSCMKLYLHKPEEGQQILKDLFKYITKECQNPDLRDRGFIYWRLLSTNPQLAKKIVLSPRPLISDQSYTLQTQFLEKLIQNIGFLSSVYLKKPQDFVKRLKDNLNAKEVVEEDVEELLAKSKQEEKVQFFQEKQVNFVAKQEQFVVNGPVDLINIQNNSQQIPQIHNEINQTNNDLLNMNQQVKKQSISRESNSSLLDLSQPLPRSYQTSLSPQNYSLSSQNYPVDNHYSTSIIQGQVNQGSSVLFYQPVINHKNIVIRSCQVVNESTYSRQNKYNGLNIKAAFQRQSQNLYLQLIITNMSTTFIFSDFALKINSNAFRLGYGPVSIPDLTIHQGQSKEVKLKLNNENTEGQLNSYPYVIECSLKINDDFIIFKLPCSLSVGMQPNFSMSLKDYQQIKQDPQSVNKEQLLRNELDLNSFIQRLKENNLYEIARKQNGENEIMLYACMLTNGVRLMAEISFNRSNNAVFVRITGPTQVYLSCFNLALLMIVNQ